MTSNQPQPHDGRRFRALLAVFAAGAYFRGHAIAGHRNEARAPEEPLRTFRKEIELSKTEFLGPSKETLEQRGANTLTGVAGLYGDRSDEATKAPHLHRDHSDDRSVSERDEHVGKRQIGG